MRFRLASSVFVRHVKNESLLWNPRRVSGSVLRDSRIFLDEIKDEWRDVDHVVNIMATKFGCSIEEVRSDFLIVLKELASQGIVVCLDDDVNDIRLIECRNRELLNGDVTHVDSQVNEEVLFDFCDRHEIPSELHLDLTDACTEKCVHCYVPRGQNHFLPYDLAEKVLREFRALNGLTVQLSGGEAMMHPDFEDVCRLCRGLNLNIVILSNMTLCDDARIEFLKEVNPQLINVSLYSMVSEEHDTITRLPGSWQRTMQAILKCCAAGITCRIATPLLKENKNAVPDLRRFAEEHQLYFMPEYDIVAQSDHCCENLAHACSADELCLVLRKERGVFRRSYDGVMPSCEEKVCDIGWRLCLSAQGNYYPCDSMHGYVLGDAAENTLVDVWKGEKLNYLRSLRNRDFGECSSCEKRPWCKLCPAANFNATGNLFKHRPGTCVLARVVQEVYGDKGGLQ